MCWSSWFRSTGQFACAPRLFLCHILFVINCALCKVNGWRSPQQLVMNPPNVSHIIKTRGVLNIPDPQMYRGWWLESGQVWGWYFASYSIFNTILGLFMVKFCHFGAFVNPNLGLTKWFNTPLVKTAAILIVQCGYYYIHRRKKNSIVSTVK